jgi:two-component system sensor histidine kinase SenX3
VDASTAAVAGLVIGGVAGGTAVAVITNRRRPRPEPAVTPDVLPAGADAVLSALQSAAVVVDASERAVWAAAAAYTLGLIHDGRLADEEVVRGVRGVRATGRVVTLDLQPRRRRRGGPRVVLSVRVAPLTDDLVLVLADDRSEAARVDDVRRDFVANVSHELKTPAGALSLLAEAVEGAADDPEAVVRFAGRMQHEAARLASMVNELIELSRLQDDDARAHAEVVELDDVVAEALDFVRTSALAKQIDLRTAGEPGVTLVGVREQLTTALRNLLENAVAYSPERTRVVVSVQQVHGEGPDRVELSVADQGIGISEADQARIFERFYRVDPARSRATGGTGLGLAIVKHVCVNHGGEVVVWSTEGAGSTFTLRLPARLDDDPADDQPAQAPADPADVPLRKVVQ